MSEFSMGKELLRPLIDVAVVGAGFAGLYMVHKLRGMNLTVCGFEASDDVGGVWNWNRYPGARCDVESLQYSYSFSPELDQEWSWTERYAGQPEILRYLQHVADRFDIRSQFMFETNVEVASFDDTRQRWVLQTTRGVFEAKFCVMATGSLSVPNRPDFPGIDTFQGTVYHTGNWPREPVDFSGQCVGVIGTGSSAIQVIPEVAQQAEHLYVFQRTPNFSIPSENSLMTQEHEQMWKSDYPERRKQMRQTKSGMLRVANPARAIDVPQEQRDEEYERRWKQGGTAFIVSFSDLLSNEVANETAAEFVRGKIRSIVTDARTAALLCPDDHPIGAKRICADANYYAQFNRPNVTLVDVRSAPIKHFTATEVVTASDRYEVDALILATGYDALTGSLFRIDIEGRAGRKLRDKWRDGPATYLGVMTAGFPNLFIVANAGSPSVLSNMVVSIEQHVEWISRCIGDVLERDFDVIEANEDAERHWGMHLNEIAAATLYPRVNSWYCGRNISGKPDVFLPYAGGVDQYANHCAEVATQNYRGFTLSRGRTGVAG